MLGFGTRSLTTLKTC